MPPDHDDPSLSDWIHCPNCNASGDATYIMVYPQPTQPNAELEVVCHACDSRQRRRFNTDTPDA